MEGGPCESGDRRIIAATAELFRVPPESRIHRINLAGVLRSMAADARPGARGVARRRAVKRFTVDVRVDTPQEVEY